MLIAACSKVLFLDPMPLNMRPYSLVLLVLLGAPHGAQSADSPWVELAGKRYNVELAKDDYSRMRGLMFRESMPRDAGMLFVFESEYPQAFWMKNTLIALDILYFDSAAKLVSMSTYTPPCKTAYCPSYPSSGAARYVLELNAGEAEKLQLQPGARLSFGPNIVGVPLEK